MTVIWEPPNSTPSPRDCQHSLPKRDGLPKGTIARCEKCMAYFWLDERMQGWNVQTWEPVRWFDLIRWRRISKAVRNEMEDSWKGRGED